MGMDQPLISSDSHVLEPRDLWVRRIDRRFAERAPRIVSLAEGDQWVADGSYRLGNLGAASAAGVRFERPESLRTMGRIEDIVAAGLDPVARLEEIDRDGVLAELLYPTVTLHAYRIRDPALVTAVLRAYNDWLLEFCAVRPERFKGIAMINVDDLGQAVKDLREAATVGMVGAAIPVTPGEGDYADAKYESLWEAAEELSLPLSMHVGMGRQLRNAGARRRCGTAPRRAGSSVRRGRRPSGRAGCRPARVRARRARCRAVRPGGRPWRTRSR